MSVKHDDPEVEDVLEILEAARPSELLVTLCRGQAMTPGYEFEARNHGTLSKALPITSRVAHVLLARGAAVAGPSANVEDGPKSGVLCPARVADDHQCILARGHDGFHRCRRETGETFDWD